MTIIIFVTDTVDFRGWFYQITVVLMEQLYQHFQSKYHTSFAPVLANHHCVSHTHFPSSVSTLSSTPPSTVSSRTASDVWCRYFAAVFITRKVFMIQGSTWRTLSDWIVRSTAETVAMLWAGRPDPRTSQPAPTTPVWFVQIRWVLREGEGSLGEPIYNVGLLCKIHSISWLHPQTVMNNKDVYRHRNVRQFLQSA